MMQRVLLVAATTGYQVRAFRDAAARMGVELVLATDRCDQIEDPWRDGAIPIRFHDEDGSVRAIVESAFARSIAAVVAVGDRPALIAALVGRALTLPVSPPEAVRIAGNKLMTRIRLRKTDLPCPWFHSFPLDVAQLSLIGDIKFPCVLKPLTLTGSRGVIRVDNTVDLERAVTRLRRLLKFQDVRTLRDPANDAFLVEEYISGHEVAVEGVMTNGALQVLATFDKPDPLEGPFFEETIYVTPANLLEFRERHVVRQLEVAARAMGLTNGAIHAELRLNDRGVFVLEIAARPIGGLCARVLRFDGPMGTALSLEDILLRHALRQRVESFGRAKPGAGVMMIPIQQAGLLKCVDGLEDARAMDGVEDVVITAKRDQYIAPLPEGSSYLGFIFARADAPADVVAALRAANECLRFEIAQAIPVNEE